MLLLYLALEHGDAVLFLHLPLLRLVDEVPEDGQDDPAHLLLLRVAEHRVGEDAVAEERVIPAWCGEAVERGEERWEERGEEV